MAPDDVAALTYDAFGLLTQAIKEPASWIDKRFVMLWPKSKNTRGSRALCSLRAPATRSRAR